MNIYIRNIFLHCFKYFSYEKLLKQSRIENEAEIRKRQDEIVALKTTIKNQGIKLLDLYYKVYYDVKLLFLEYDQFSSVLYL